MSEFAKRIGFAAVAIPLVVWAVWAGGAALAVMIALTTTLRTHPARSGPLPWLAVGIAMAAIPWLSTKYAPMSAVLCLVVLNRLRGTATPLVSDSCTSPAITADSAGAPPL